MHFIFVSCAILLTMFSVSVMTYITIATPIGPWIGPTLALCMVGLMSLIRCRCTNIKSLYPVLSASIGGINATAFGFSFPTLYFLDPVLFNHLIYNRPFYFIGIIVITALLASCFGFIIAQIIERQLLDEQNLPFPIGQLMYKIMASQHMAKQVIQLISGFFSTLFYGCIMTFASLRGFFSNQLVIIPSLRFGLFSLASIDLNLSILPMLLAIGFVSGHIMLVPLLIGTIARIFFIDVVQYAWFSNIGTSDFLLAFCSGMVVSGAIGSLLIWPKYIYHFIIGRKILINKNIFVNCVISLFVSISGLVVIVCLLLFFRHLELSWIASLYILITTIICVYQIAVIAGRIGLALLGRFATFVMIPGLLLFGFNAIQSTITATFVEVASGTAVDVLFGRRAARSASLDNRLVILYQLLGVIFGSLIIGLVFWLLVSHIQLGSVQFCAQRAHARALLIQVNDFNFYIVLFGALFGYILKVFSINAMLVLGGILMMPSLTLGLIGGGILTLFVINREKYEPLCSGVYAANSLWMIINALLMI